MVIAARQLPPEAAGGFPSGVPLGFNVLGLVGFSEFLRHEAGDYGKWRLQGKPKTGLLFNVEWLFGIISVFVFLLSGWSVRSYAFGKGPHYQSDAEYELEKEKYPEDGGQPLKSF
ncbi:MAG: hypothetical protein ACFB21_10715 [Opitutales bacterium]